MGRNPTIQHIIFNLHTKYDYSSLQGFIEIFDDKFIIQSIERKKLGHIHVQGRISRRLGCNPTIQHIIINLHTKFIIQSMERQEAQMGPTSLTWVFCHNLVKIHLVVIEMLFSCSVLLLVKEDGDHLATAKLRKIKMA